MLLLPAAFKAGGLIQRYATSLSGKSMDWIDLKVRSLGRRRFRFKNSISGAKEVSAAARAERGRDPQVEFSCRISGQTKLRNLLVQSLPLPKSEVG